MRTITVDTELTIDFKKVSVNKVQLKSFQCSARTLEASETWVGKTGLVSIIDTALLDKKWMGNFFPFSIVPLKSIHIKNVTTLQISIT